MCARFSSHSLWAGLLAVAMLVGLPAIAGEVGQLVGLVTDEDGRAIAGARLSITGPGTAGSRITWTDAEGRYRIFALDTVRPVNILAEAEGKIAVEFREYRIRTDRTNRLDVTLRSQGAQEILVLLDARVPYHRLTLDGARSTLHGQTRLMEVTEATPSVRRDLLRALAEDPTVVLAIGEEAAKLARSVARDVPVVHCMVPDPHPAEMAAANTCGLPLIGDFARQIDRLQRLDPGIQRVGTIYDPSRLGSAVSRFRQAAAEAGITLVAGQVHNPEDLPRALDDLAWERLDAFVVLMDPEIYTARNFTQVRRFAEEKDLILIVPDPSMAGTEKAFTIGPTFWEAGAVAGYLVSEIAEGRLSPADLGLLELTEAEVAVAAAGASPALRWNPAPNGEPPLIGVVTLAAELQDPSPEK